MAVEDGAEYEWVPREETRSLKCGCGCRADELTAPRSAHLALLALQQVEFDHHYEDGE
jgi:hypothetical protein